MDQIKKKEESMNPLYHFLLLVIVLLGVIFLFYGLIRSNFGYPPLEDIPERVYQSYQTGIPDASPVPVVNLSPLKQTLTLDPEVVTPNQFNNRLEQLILEKTKEERLNRNLSKVSSEEGLAKTARYHSSDMAKRDFFDHQNPDNMGPALRVAKIYRRYIIGILAENIYMITRGTDTPQILAEKIMRGWMNSSGHRANILKPDLNALGVGCFETRKDNQPVIFATQVFGKNVGFLKTDFPQQCEPNREIPVTVEVIDPTHLAAETILIVRVSDRKEMSRFPLISQQDRSSLKADTTIRVPDQKGVYQLEFHIPYRDNKNTYGIFRGPIFTVKKEN